MPKQLPADFQTVETRCGSEGQATPDRGGPRKSPDWVDPKTSGWASKRTRKVQRDGHNSGVKIWSLCSVSSTLSHANLTNKVRGEYFSKKVFLRLPRVFIMCVVYSCFCLWYCAVVILNDDVDDYLTVHHTHTHTHTHTYIYREREREKERERERERLFFLEIMSERPFRLYKPVTATFIINRCSKNLILTREFPLNELYFRLRSVVKQPI